MSVMGLTMGPGPPPEHHPFHCWSVFRTSRILTFLRIMRNMAHIHGVYVTPQHHPFHCWLVLMCRIDDTFLSGNSLFCKKVEKTLG